MPDYSEGGRKQMYEVTVRQYRPNYEALARPFTVWAANHESALLEAFNLSVNGGE